MVVWSVLAHQPLDLVGRLPDVADVDPDSVRRPAETDDDGGVLGPFEHHVTLPQRSRRNALGVRAKVVRRAEGLALREWSAARGPRSRAAQLVERLLRESAEFRALWELQEAGLCPATVKHFVHPEVGPLEPECQTLLEPEQSHLLLVYTAVPGSESYEKLQLLSVIGHAIA